MMKTHYLLPNRYKKYGWFLFVPGIILGTLFIISHPRPDFLDINVFAMADQSVMGDTEYFLFTKDNVLDEITGLLVIIGAIFIAFSKEKSEDEFITKIRLESLVWATYFNYFILVLTVVFIYGMAFLWVLVFNMFTILFFFIIRFNWALHKSKNQMRNEE